MALMSYSHPRRTNLPPTPTLVTKQIPNNIGVFEERNQTLATPKGAAHMHDPTTYKNLFLITLIIITSLLLILIDQFSSALGFGEAKASNS